MKKYRKARVLILADVAGSGPHYHAGEEAMAMVAVERLKAIAGPENLVLLCPHPRGAGRAYGLKAVYMPLRTARTWLLYFILAPVTSWVQVGRLLWHLLRAGAVFKTGGGNLRGRANKFPLLDLAALLQKPVFLASQTVGPLQGGFRAALRKTLAQSQWIGVRDRDFSSRQVGLPVHFAPDDAVFLSPRHDAKTRELARRNGDLAGLSFAGIRRLSGGAYQRIFEAAGEVLAEHGATPVFIPHHLRGRQSDGWVAELLRETLVGARPVVLDYVPPAPAIMALTGEMLFVLGNRYHAVVFALAMGVPAVALYHDEYTEARMRGAFEQFELEPYLLDLAEADAKLADMAARALARRDAFRKAAERVKEEKLSANRAPYDKLAALLGARASRD